MSRFLVGGFPQNSAERIGEDSSASSDLINWFCDATLVGGFASCFGLAKNLKQRQNFIQIETAEDETLTQLWGLPLTRHHLQEALTASCKRVVHLLRGSAQYGSESVAVKILTIIKQAFRRVSRFLFGEDAPEDEDIKSTIQNISANSDALENSRNQVVLLASVWVSCCLLQGQSVEVQLMYTEQILDASIEKNGSCIQGQAASHHRQVAEEHSGLRTQLRGIMCYLRICALLQAEEWIKCVEVINKDLHSIPSQLRDQALYMKAYSLYYHGNYSEAMETCRMLSEMISQDGVLSQVHNLMGCCLRQMGKPHMALQQFRKALAASSFIPPPSLFNVSVIYRDLGEEEAEMESLLVLEKTMDPSADVSEDDRDDADTSLGPAWPAVILIPNTCTKKGSIHPVQAIGHLTASYTLARRSLDLNQIENAAERFLDLLSILETSSVAVDDGNRGSNMLLPSLQNIYLDTASSLLKANRTEEALAVCDKLLSKSKLLHHEDMLHLEPFSQESEEETLRRCDKYPFLVRHANLSSEERSKLERNSQESTSQGDLCDKSIPVSSGGSGKAGVFGQNEMGRDGNGGDVGRQGNGMHKKEHCMSRQTLGGRKRQREPSEDTYLRSGSSRMFGNQLDRSKDESDVGRKSGCDDERRSEDLEEEVAYTAHALILQAKCLFKQGDRMAAITEVDHSLEILQTSGEDGNQVDPKMEKDSGIEDKSIAKRRRIGSDTVSDCAIVPDDRGSSPPDRQPAHSVILKSTAYHLKASILISQDKLHDAMKSILMSLHCCPNNADTLKTHAILLEKLGRKSEAVKAWSRLKEAKASDQVVHCL